MHDRFITLLMAFKEVTFGYYECQMLPPGIAGTVTSCMVENTINTYYEAVYIKFFGNDTGRVYIGFFAQGTGYAPLLLPSLFPL